MDRMIESNGTYVMDCGYAKYELFNRIVEAGTSRWTAVLSGASAEMRARDDPEFDDLPGSGYQPTLLVELADDADYGNASQEIFGHLIFVQRLTPRRASHATSVRNAPLCCRPIASAFSQST
jgi:hypothetical protein